MEDQEQIKQSFPSTDEETDATLPPSIESLLNKNDNSSSSIIRDMNNNDEPKTKKNRSRKTNSSSSRPIRSKVVKETSIRNEPYTVPYPTRFQAQQQQQQLQQLFHQQDSSSSTVECSNTSEVNTADSQVLTTERKRHCAKCRESTKIVKMINSKMSRMEELVLNLKNVTDEFGHDIRDKNLFNPTTKSVALFRGLDFSKMSISDLQKFVMIVTNAIMTANPTPTRKNSDSNVIKSE